MNRAGERAGVIDRKRALSILMLTLLIAVSLATGYANLWAQAEPPAVRVGGEVKPPLKVKDVKPMYPAPARQARLQGVVVMEITVGTDGKVKSAKVIKSVPALDLAATDAVKQWEFKPTLVDGKPTPVIMPVALTFRLD